MYINRAGRRVMRGVRSPECAGLITLVFHPGARGRPNNGMHATTDTTAVKLRRGAARRVMPALGRLVAETRAERYGAWSRGGKRLRVAAGRVSVPRVAAPVAGSERGALRAYPVWHRGLTSACTRPPTRRFSCSVGGPGGA
jgi:hypothetical protein